MKTTKISTPLITFLALSIVAGLFAGGVTHAQAQSSLVWSEPVNLSNSGATSNPVLVSDQLGKLHAIWLDQFEGFTYAVSEDGKQWTQPLAVDYPFDKKAGTPVLVAAPRGFIHVFWQNFDKDLVYGQGHSEILDDPAAWGFRESLSANVLSYNVSIDPQGVVHLVYIRNKNSDLGPAGVYYARSLDEGRSWIPERLIYESQYFRTAKPEIAHLRVVVPDDANDGRVFITWGNTALKRIFMTQSSDGGANWSEVIQVKGPEDTGGYDMPFNGELSVKSNKTLFLWEVGEPGANQCNLYGQWSEDNGATWSSPDVILSNRSICPSSIEFLSREENSLIILLKYAQGSPSLVTWDGQKWSDPQFQDELSNLSNPATNETILLGCQFNAFKENQLFLIGCDLGSGGDIWIMSREVLPVAEQAVSASLWSLPQPLTSVLSQGIPLMAYTADAENLHALWVQTSLSSDSDVRESIYYSKWNGGEWAAPVNIIYGLSGKVGHLVTAYGSDRLYMVWSDKDAGSLLFSWSNAGKASSPNEWSRPVELPSPAQWTSSPDILVDSAGMIAIIYAVPINENRGIYMIQSIDNGATWTQPLTVFDAASAGWIGVNDPQVALGGDGRLHVLLTEYPGIENKPGALYYVQSEDGGETWTQPEVVSEGSVVWSEITSYDAGSIHRVWQQDDGAVVANFDQASSDGGITWGKRASLSGVSKVPTSVALPSNQLGELHFVQLTRENDDSNAKEDNLLVEDWKWDGTQWVNQPFQKIKIKGDGLGYSIAAGIAPQGHLTISLLADYFDLSGERLNEIYHIDRVLKDYNPTGAAYTALIGNVIIVPASTEMAELPSPTPEPTAIPPLPNSAPSPIVRNLAGVLLILFVVGVTVFIFLRRARKTG